MFVKNLSGSPQPSMRHNSGNPEEESEDGVYDPYGSYK